MAKLNKALVLLATTGFVASVFLTKPVDAASLRDAISYAVKNNPRIVEAQASRRATDHVLDQAQGRYLPQINLSADVGRQRIDRPEGFGPLVNRTTRTRRQATLSVRQVLFDGFDRANDVYRSQARISAAASRVLARSEAVALNVVEAYIDVVRHSSLLRLAKQNVVRHRKLLNLVKLRVSGGKSSEGDEQQTAERLEAAIALVSQIKIALGTSKAKYKSAVGKSPKRLKSVRNAKGLPKSSENALQIAINKNPRLTALRADIDVADFDREQFKSSLYPQVYLEGSASRGEDLEGTPGRSDEVKGMVVLSWTLYDGGIRNSRIEELTEREAVKVAEYDTLVRDIREQIEISWVRWKEGGRQAAAVNNQLKQNIRVVASYQKEYEAGKRSLLDVLDSESSRFASEFDLSNIRSIQKFASYQVVAHMGTLLDHFGVAAPSGSSTSGVKFKQPRRTKAFSGFKIPSLRQD